MIRRAVKALVYVTAFGVLCYLFFFVPLGRRTMWEHVQRIAATDEAQDLSEDVSSASDRAGAAVREKIREVTLDAGRDAGAP